MIEPAGTDASRGRASRGVTAALLALPALLACLALTGVAAASEVFDEPPLPHSQMPLAEPVVHVAANLHAQRATTWRGDEDVRYVLLENDVRFEVGVYGFEAERAVARIVIEPWPGRPIHHLALYMDEARPLRGHGPVVAEGERLLVTASTTGGVGLSTDLLRDTDPPDAPPDVDLVTAALDRMRHRDARLAQPTLPAPQRPLFDPEVWERRDAQRRRVGLPTLLRAAPPVELFPEPEQPAPLTPPTPEEGDVPAPAAEPGAATPTDRANPEDDEPPGADVEAQEAVLPVSGVVRYAADRFVGEPGERESFAMLIGNVRIFYEDHDTGRHVTLQTERAVVFLPGTAEREAERAVEREGEREGEREAGDGDPVPALRRPFDAGLVRGIYLEDNAIITDGRYTVRAPRMYYDLRLNQAVLLEAVAFAQDPRLDVPIYLRADAVRQTSRRSFEARRALVTTSDFAEPHFAIGAGRLTFEERETPDGEPRQWVTARHTTFRVLTTPVLYWPYVSAPVERPPIRSVSVGHSSRTGLEVQTRWDPFALAGRTPPEHMDAAVDIDYRGEHGAGLGVDVEYDPEGIAGELRGYLLPHDRGTDRIADRDRIDHDGDVRGFVRWQHRQELPNDWHARVETAYVSDETFLEEFFRSEALEARPYETSFYLNRRDHDWQLDLLAQTHLTDFVPQLAPLQTPGYQVERMPELGYYRTGTNLARNHLTWFSENRFSRVRLHFGDAAPEDYGFTEAQSQTLFNIADPDTRFEDAFTDADLPDDWRLRFDTRQEITAPMRAGELDVTPYVVGRATLYDDGFDDLGEETDRYRLLGSVGMRLSTRFQRTFADARSRMLNLRGLRHIVEPRVDAFYIATTLEHDELPVFDPTVEPLGDGSGVRVGMVNTLQTRRGGENRWRSVDWITLQTDAVFRSRDGEIDAVVPRFYGHRPEFTRGGDHFYTRVLWMVSDTLGVTGELTTDIERNTVTQWRVGAELDHTPRLRSHASYRELEVFDSRLLTYGFGYRLTTKYYLDFRHQLDFGEEESRRIRVTLERAFPQAVLRIFADFDQIDDDQMVGVAFVPDTGGRTRYPDMFGR